MPGSRFGGIFVAIVTAVSGSLVVAELAACGLYCLLHRAERVALDALPQTVGSSANFPRVPNDFKRRFS